MTRVSIDINADLGEGAGQDHLIMPLISSCNIACGGHIGDEKSMYETIILATKNNVRIGAHPSYPDKENFGRIPMDIADVDLKESLKCQLTHFYQVAKENNQTVHHIKAHGALYNKVAKEERIANIFLDVISDLGVKSKLFVPYNSVIHKLAHSKHECLIEAFIDRGYNDDLSLVSRDNKDALHKTPQAAWKQLHEIAIQKHVKTKSGSKVEFYADTFCIHGDHPNAKGILEYIHHELLKLNISLQK